MPTTALNVIKTVSRSGRISAPRGFARKCSITLRVLIWKIPGGLRLKNATIQQVFSRALDSLIEQIKLDRSVLAAILCGSLSYDAVWAKSDIDLVLVTIDDRKVKQSDMALYA